MNRSRTTYTLAPLRGSRCRARELGSGATRLFVHHGLHASRRRQPERPLAGHPGAKQPVHRSSCPTYPGLFGSWCAGPLDLPKAFEPPRRQDPPPAADEGWPPRPRRSRRHAADWMVIVGVCGLCRRQQRMPAAEPIELCEFCEHRSPPFPRIAAVGEREAKRSARCDRLA